MKEYKLKGISQSYSCMQDSLSWNHEVQTALNNLKISDPVSSICISWISGLLKSSCNFMNALIKLSWCCVWNPIFLLTSATYSCPECEQKANLVKTNHYFSTSDLAHHPVRQGWAAKKRVFWTTSFSSSDDLHYLSNYGLSKFWDSCSSLWIDAGYSVSSGIWPLLLCSSEGILNPNAHPLLSVISTGLISDVLQFLFVITRERTVSNSRQMSDFKLQASNLCIFAPC